MPRFTLDGQEVEAAAGTTILRAARERGLRIPTLCWDESVAPCTSCMVCVVRDARHGRLIPSCSYPVQDGLIIETGGEEVLRARREAIELLLSDHLGDCEAPCRRGCPAGVDVPRMLRFLRAGRPREALIEMKRALALPATLGYICHAPCEKPCRRALHDGAVSIRLLRRHIAELDLACGAPWRPGIPPDNGRRIAIVGAGPAGLSAAWYLRQDGFGVRLFDEHDAPGGNVRRGVPEDRLPRAVLDAEIALIGGLGIDWRLGARVGGAAAFDEIRSTHDAVIVATGACDAAVLAAWGLEQTGRGVRVDAATRATSRAGVFAAGDVVQGARQSVRSVAEGREAARSAAAWALTGKPATVRRRFNSRMGRLAPEELARFVADASPAPRARKEGIDGLAPAEALAEAARCLDCDCRKADGCALRDAADEYGAQADAFRGEGRRPFERVDAHDEVVYESGKCIQCGLCVRIAEQYREPLGLAFVGRGFDVRIAVPFNEELRRGLTTAARECVRACPTAALAFQRWPEC